MIANANHRLMEFARTKLPIKDLQHVPGVVVFAEHSARNPRTDELEIYDREALEKIADRCNRRIEETGDFAVLCDGHTRRGKEIDDPDVLGYVGPFHVGVYGKIDGRDRAVIYADEWHFKEAAERLKKQRRRSAEVWLADAMEDRILDPIAALGSHTPRLDLGINTYQRGGCEVVCYSAYPAGGNTFVQKEINEAKEESRDMNSQDDVRKVIDAITSLEAWKWLESKMEEDMQASAAAESQLEAETPSEGPELDTKDQTVDESPPPEPEKDRQEGSMNYESMSDDDLKAAHKGCRDEYMKRFGDDEPSAEEKANYSRLQSEYDALKSTVTAIQREKADAERSLQIEQLGADYAITDETLESLREKSLYSRNANISDEVFADKVETIKSVAKRRPHGEALAAARHAVLPQSGAERDEEQEQYMRKAVAYAEQYMREEGKEIDFDRALAHVKSNGQAVAQ